MLLMSRTSFVLAALVAISLLSTSARAQPGTLTVSVLEAGDGPPQIFTAAGSLSSGITAGSFSPPTITTPDYSITVVSGTAQQTSLSEVLSSATKIENTSGSPNHVLEITITGTGFTAPITPPDILGLSHIGGTVPVLSTPSTNSLTFTSTVAGIGFGAQTPSITTLGVSYASDTSQILTAVTAPYSIIETLTVTLNALNDTLNYSSSTTVTSIVPEPSTLAIAGLGGLGLVGYGLRRRKAKA